MAPRTLQCVVSPAIRTCVGGTQGQYNGNSLYCFRSLSTPVISKEVSDSGTADFVSL